MRDAREVAEGVMSNYRTTDGVLRSIKIIETDRAQVREETVRPEGAAVRLPIVTSLDHAPEVGDAVLQLTPEYDLDIRPTWCIPVRNRLPSWKIRSVAGWNTTAEIPPALHFTKPIDIGKFNPDPSIWNFKTIVFAPTAAEAVARYHQEAERCPFGEVRLVDRGGWLFFFSDHKGPLISFRICGVTRELQSHGPDHHHELIAIHFLLGEVIAYQRAEALGTKDSRVHRSLEGKS